jgi:hypothetical protein
MISSITIHSCLKLPLWPINLLWYWTVRGRIVIQIFRGTAPLIVECKRIRDISVVQHWATGWMIGGSSPGRGWEFFSSPPCPERLWGPPSLLSNGYQGLLKRLRREADYSPPSSAEVKNAWSYTSLPQYAFMTWCFVKEEEQRQLYLYFYDLLTLCSRVLLEKPKVAQL